MRIQGKKMWIAGQFMAAQLLSEEGEIREVLPSVIDIHTRGAYGYDTNDARPEGLR